MEITLRNTRMMMNDMANNTLAKGIEWGLMGGFVAMMIVDLTLMGALSTVGLPPLVCFSTVGNTVGRFFTFLGIATPGGVRMGVATHYLVGPILGGIFGAALVRYGTPRVRSLKKCVVLSLLYAEAVSQPLFVMIPVLMKMTASETLVWFFGSVVMHFIWGIILGVILGRGLRFAPASKNI